MGKEPSVEGNVVTFYDEEKDLIVENFTDERIRLLIRFGSQECDWYKGIKTWKNVFGQTYKIEKFDPVFGIIIQDGDSND